MSEPHDSRAGSAPKGALCVGRHRPGPGRHSVKELVARLSAETQRLQRYAAQQEELRRWVSRELSRRDRARMVAGFPRSGW